MQFLEDYTWMHPQLYRVLLFLTLSLCSTENGTACFYPRICQVTTGASPGHSDVITTDDTGAGHSHPNLQADIAFNQELSAWSWTSEAWLPCDPYSPSYVLLKQEPWQFSLLLYRLQGMDNLQRWIHQVFTQCVCTVSSKSNWYILERPPDKQATYLSGLPTLAELTESGETLAAASCKAALAIW